MFVTIWFQAFHGYTPSEQMCRAKKRRVLVTQMDTDWELHYQACAAVRPEISSQAPKAPTPGKIRVRKRSDQSEAHSEHKVMMIIVLIFLTYKRVFGLGFVANRSRLPGPNLPKMYGLCDENYSAIYLSTDGYQKGPYTNRICQANHVSLRITDWLPDWFLVLL